MTFSGLRDLANNIRPSINTYELQKDTLDMIQQNILQLRLLHLESIIFRADLLWAIHTGNPLPEPLAVVQNIRTILSFCELSKFQFPFTFSTFEFAIRGLSSLITMMKWDGFALPPEVIQNINTLKDYVNRAKTKWETSFHGQL